MHMHMITAGCWGASARVRTHLGLVVADEDGEWLVGQRLHLAADERHHAARVVRVERIAQLRAAAQRLANQKAYEGDARVRVHAHCARLCVVPRATSGVGSAAECARVCARATCAARN
eukprot:2588208-Prymnesium_polylepis.1